MLIREKLIRELAKEYNVPAPVVRSVVFSPLRFTRRVVGDRYDYRPVRVRHFGAFVMKKRYLKAIEFIEDMYDIMIQHIDYVYMIMVTLLGFQLVDSNSAKRVLKEALDSNDIDKMRLIFKEFIMHITPKV